MKILQILLATITLSLVTSCVSAKWTSRIGKYTYDDALAEYGPPDDTEQLSNGYRVSSWTTSYGLNWIDKLIMTFDQHDRLIKGGEKRF